MKRKLLFVIKANTLFFFLYFISTSKVIAQLHGTYTINPSLSVSTSNYLTFASAVSDLSSGTRADGGTTNGPGVSGAVTFTVSSGTYSTQVVIPITTGNISGASSTNTITFNGGTGNAANVILTSSGTSGNYATLVFNGCDYVTFKNMTISNTNSSNGFGVIFYSCSPVPRFPGYPNLANIPCNNNKLQYCIINTISTSSTNVTGVFFGDSLTSLDPFANAKYDTIDRCSIHGGYYNIYMTYDSENVFSNDSLLNAYKGGLHISTSAGFKIRNNYIASSSTSISSTSNIGIQIIGGATSTSSDYAEISNNIIYQFTEIGIAIQSAPGTSGYPTRIFNNFIGGGIPTSSTDIFGCIYATSSTGYIDFWNNSLSLNTSGVSTNSACIELLSTGGNWSIENNIFSYIGSSTTKGEGIYSSSGTLSGSTVDYNIFYNPTNTSLETTLNGTVYSSSTLISGGGFNSHSQVINPNFVSTTVTSPNLNITSQNPRGVNISIVTTDINGITRVNPPCIGADEISPVIVASAGSATSICSGSSTTIGGSPTALYGVSPYTYSWSPTTSLSSSTIANPTASPTTTTTYNITVSDSHSDPVATASVIVTVNPLPTISVAPSSVCNDISRSITASGANTYTWSPATGLNTTTASTVTATLASTTTYTITGTSSSGCVNSISQTITVLPITPITVSPSSVGCDSGTVLTGSGGSGLGYTWVPYTALSSSLGTSVTATLTATTTFTISDNGGCSSAVTKTITVNIPTITVQPNSTYNVDENSNVSIGLTTTNTSVYQWKVSTDGGSTFSNVTNGGVYSGATISILTLTNVPASMSGYVYQCVLGSGGCVTSTSTTLNVYSGPPTITTDLVNASVCTGQPANFNVIAVGTLPFSYQWTENAVTLSDGGIYSGTSTSNLTLSGVTYSMNGNIYQCNITNAYGNTYSMDAVLIINPVCGLANASGDSLVTIILSAIGPNPLNVQWDGIVLPSRDSLMGFINRTPGLDSLSIDTMSYHDLDSLRSCLTKSVEPGIHFVRINDSVGDSSHLLISVGERLEWNNSSSVSFSTGFIPNLIDSDTTHIYGPGVTISREGPATVGMTPFGSLIQASNGLLYGMTSIGGVNGDGIIFSYNTSTGTSTDIYDFGNGTDGSHPQASLVQASDGLLYGITQLGGVYGTGMFFSYNIATGIETDLHDFGNGTDGNQPWGSIIQASDGLLYGMTQDGGANGVGIIFSYNISTGSETDIYDFGSGYDGMNPWGSLLQATDGLLYGTTQNGGAYGLGMFFNYNISTGIETDLHDFGSSGTDGANPEASFIQNIYGELLSTTTNGGDYGGGTIFVYVLSGGYYIVAHSFGNGSDGAYPVGSLTQASESSDHWLYGMTQNGGANGVGMIYRYQASDSYTDMYDFNNTTDGQMPTASFLQASNNILYGMTPYGGANGDGTILSYNISTTTESDLDDFGTTDGDWTDGYAYSSNLIATNQQGAVEFEISDNSTQEAVGLVFTDSLTAPDSLESAQIYYQGNSTINFNQLGMTHGARGFTAQAGYSDMQYAFLFNAGTMSIIEAGTTVLSQSFNSGDIFDLRIEKNSGSGQYYLNYYQNDALLHATALSSSAPAQYSIKNSIFTFGGSISAMLNSTALLIQPTISGQITDVTCDHPNSGSITAYYNPAFYISGATPPTYTYSWVNNQTNTSMGTGQTISNLSPGSYTVTSNGISAKFTVAYSTTWQNNVNANAFGANDNYLLKNPSNDGSFDAGANSADFLASGTNGWTEFTLAPTFAVTTMLDFAYGLSDSLPVTPSKRIYGFDINIFTAPGGPGTLPYWLYSFVYPNSGGTKNAFVSVNFNPNISHTLRVALHGDSIYYYDNSVVVHTFTPPVANIYLTNAALGFDGTIINSRSSFGCNSSSIYATLGRTLDGDYYIMHDSLNFKFDEEYKNSKGELSYTIYDKTNAPIAYTGNPTLKDIATSADFGENYFLIPMSTFGSTLSAGNYYTLEALNAKGEKWYMRFTIK